MGNGRSANLNKSNNIRKRDDDKRVQQPSNNSTNSNSSSTYYRMSQDDFSKLSINDASKLMNDVEKAINNKDLWGMGLNGNNFYQKTLMALGLHGKPTVLDNATFDQAFTTDSATPLLFRGMNSESDVKSLKFGDFTYASGGMHGCGAGYFATDVRYARGYGYNKKCGVQAFIDKNKMKSITEGDLRTALSKESTAVQKAFRGYSGLASYALYKGYNTIHIPGGNMGNYTKPGVSGTHGHGGHDFYQPLTRDILVIRKTPQ